MKDLLKEFKDFINKGDIVDLAVALIFALAVKAIIDALVNSIISPLIGAIFGKQNFNYLTVTVNNGTIGYGAFITAVINFLIIAFALFVLVKAYNASKNIRKKPGEAETAEATEVELLTEIRDLLKTR